MWRPGARRTANPVRAIRIHASAKRKRWARWSEMKATVMAKMNAAAQGGVERRLA